MRSATNGVHNSFDIRGTIDRVKIKVVVLGSTGSIGTQALEILKENTERFELVGIAAHGSKPELLLEQIHSFGLPAERVAVASERTIGSTPNSAAAASAVLILPVSLWSQSAMSWRAMM